MMAVILAQDPLEALETVHLKDPIAVQKQRSMQELKPNNPPLKRVLLKSITLDDDNSGLQM